MTDLRLIYPLISRPWTATELADRLAAASKRGEGDLSPEDRHERPIGYLASAIPRLVSLAVAVNTIHLAPSAIAAPDASLPELLDIVDRTSAGGLRRCQLALELVCTNSADRDDCLTIATGLAGELLERAAPDAEPRSVATHAQQACRWTAIAIDLLDRDDIDAFGEAMADCLGRLLVACVFADAARGRLSATFGAS